MTRHEQNKRHILFMLKRFTDGAAVWQVLGNVRQLRRQRAAALDDLLASGAVELTNGGTMVRLVRMTSGA